MAVTMAPGTPSPLNVTRPGEPGRRGIRVRDREDRDESHRDRTHGYREATGDGREVLPAGRSAWSITMYSCGPVVEVNDKPIRARA